MPGHKEGGWGKAPHSRGDLAMKVAVALRTRYLFMAVPWSVTRGTAQSSVLQPTSSVLPVLVSEPETSLPS